MKQKCYLIHEVNGWLATPEKFFSPDKAIEACKSLAGANVIPLGDMNVFLERELPQCRFKGDNGEFFIRGRDSSGIRRIKKK